MRLPRSLYNAYNNLKKSRVVVKKNVDDEALTYFQNVLNSSGPKNNDEFVLYTFVRGLYYENKYKFISFIRNTSFECLVLWTEWRNIVDFLYLRNVINIKWQSQLKQFKVTKYNSSPEQYVPPEPPADLGLSSDSDHKNVKKWADVISSDDDAKVQ